MKNSVRAARDRIEAGRAVLRGTESAVFSQVVAAYMDVLRDRAVVGLNRSLRSNWLEEPSRASIASSLSARNHEREGRHLGGLQCGLRFRTREFDSLRSVTPPILSAEICDRT